MLNRYIYIYEYKLGMSWVNFETVAAGNRQVLTDSVRMGQPVVD
jgi:hypothetical protein